ncbi:MAG TPA: putative Ig domain-containing protein, partial [Bryobacteraceae bacterium]
MTFIKAFFRSTLPVVLGLAAAALHAQDLSVSKSHTGNFVRGQTGATYTITVTNALYFTSEGSVVVTETVPTGLIATSISGEGWQCSQPSGPCGRVDPVQGFQSYPPLTLTVNVATDAPSSVTNTVRICCDENSSNDTATDPTTILSNSPTITSLAASKVTSNVPNILAAITSASPIAAFKLYIGGTGFDPNQITTVSWTDTSTNTTTVIGGNSLVVTPTQIVATIPSPLFSTPVSSQVSAQIVVNQRFSADSTVASSNTGIVFINPPLATLGPNLPSGVVGTSYFQRYFTGGTAPYSVSLQSGSLPNGLGFLSDAVSISGTPTASGSFTFQPVTTDVWGNSIAPTDTIVITGGSAAPVITSVVPNSASAGISSVQITVNGSNFTASTFSPGSAVTWTAPNSSPVSLSTTFVSASQLTATIPGTLLQSPLTAIINVLQSSSSTSSTSSPVISNGVPFTVKPPSISALSPAGATVGAPAFTLTVTGADFVQNLSPAASTQISFGGTQLPTTFVNSGSLTAPVSTAMISTPGPVTVVAVNPGGSRSAAATFNVFGAPTLISLNPNSAIAGGPAFTLTVTGTNFTNGMTIKWNGSSLITACNGASSGATALTACATNQLITTVPVSLIASPGTASVSVVSADGVSTGSLPFTIFPGLVITTASLPPGNVGTPYSTTLTASGGTTPYLWAATGLPAGLLLNTGTGAITGIPTTAGSSTVSVTVTDSNGLTAAARFPLTITNKLVITTASLPGGTVGASYSATLTASGGVTPYVWSATGLPPGLLLNTATGAITGTPTAAGNFTASVTVNDNSEQSASAQFPLVIGGNLTITTASLPAGTVGTSYSVTLTATGGLTPYVWSSTTLPPGLFLNTATGAITGTPTTSGSFPVSVTVNDNGGQTASKSLVLAISPSRLVITTTSLPSGVVGVAYSAPVNAV